MIAGSASAPTSTAAPSAGSETSEAAASRSMNAPRPAAASTHYIPTPFMASSFRFRVSSPVPDQPGPPISAPFYVGVL
jgi:hypothetical protein